MSSNATLALLPQNPFLHTFLISLQCFGMKSDTEALQQIQKIDLDLNCSRKLGGFIHHGFSTIGFMKYLCFKADLRLTFVIGAKLNQHAMFIVERLKFHLA